MGHKILVTGGAGYVGAVLVPQLIRRGHEVRVLDLMIYGDDVYNQQEFDRKRLEVFKGDIRDQDLLKKVLGGIDTVIHLACISNDPSFDLNPELGRSINLDAFEPLVKLSKQAGVKRFINASSSSVYGIKEVASVTEDMSLEPLTDYSRFKAATEEILYRYASPEWTVVSIRPATVCGYSPRQRLDVIVNILTNHAYHNREIKVFGGKQLRPNIHIQDMVEAYILLLDAPSEKINKQVFNAGLENHSVEKLAELVKKVIGDDVKVTFTETNDNRSYHISSDKICRELGFEYHHTIEDAIRDLKIAFDQGQLPDSLIQSKYFNIKKMLEVGLM